jgi:lysyl-tRNA synthetase class 2
MCSASSIYPKKRYIKPLVGGKKRVERTASQRMHFTDGVTMTLIQPTFVTHLPKELVPLAKLSPDDPTTVEVFECCINGREIAPGYTEQNDPIAQRTTLEHQAGGEQQKLDEDFLVALEHGMPPAGGIGIGFDRLRILLVGLGSFRDAMRSPGLPAPVFSGELSGAAC